MYKKYILRGLAISGAFFVLSFFISGTVHAATVTSVASGNWNSPPTWGNATSSGTGTISAPGGAKLVTGTGTLFTAELAVGDVIIVDGSTYVVATITSDTVLHTKTNTIAIATGTAFTYGEIPLVSDDVVVESSTSVNYNFKAGQTGNITINNGGTLDFSIADNLTGLITVSSGGTLICNAALGIKNNLNPGMIVSGTVRVDINAGLKANGAGNTPTVQVGNGGLINFLSAAPDPGTSTLWAFDAGSTVEYSRAGIQTIDPSVTVAYSNLTLSGSGVKTLGTTTTINGTLSLQGTSRFAKGGFELIYGAAATLEYKGSDVQTARTEFTTPWVASGGVIINNANGVVLNANKKINSSLTLTAGNIITGDNTLYIGSAGTVSRTSGHINGNLKKRITTGSFTKTFEIGDASNYTPVDIAFNSVTGAGDLTISTTAGNHPDIASSTLSSIKNVSRYWTAVNSGIVLTDYDAVLNFAGGDVVGGADTNNIIVGKYSGGFWTYPTVGTKNATNTQVTGLTEFSDFQMGEIASADKAITAFNLASPATVGVINEAAKTAILSVPYGTSLNNLVPTITITGVSVNPASGAAQTFVDGIPSTYTVTADNASTQDYAVTVNVASAPTPIVYGVAIPVTVHQTVSAQSMSESCPALVAGDMVKVVGKPAIYVLNNNFETLYFPSGDVFKSWRPTYGGYKSISHTCFDVLKTPAFYPGAINYRYGSYIIKRASSDQLYVVEPNNTASKITPAVAVSLYGKDYKVMAVEDYLWPNYYNRGAEIENTIAHPGMLVKVGGIIYFVNKDNIQQEVTADGMTANGFQDEFVHTLTSAAISGLTVGEKITAAVPALTDKTQSSW
jgi:hypothetical protein